MTVIDAHGHGPGDGADGELLPAVAVNPTTNKIYVANNYAHSVTVIDGATHATTTVRVGPGSRAIVVNPVTNKIYTANYGSKDATEIDGATNTATAARTGKHPWAITLIAGPTYLRGQRGQRQHLHSRRRDGHDEERRTVGDISFAAAVNQVTNKAYVLSYTDNSMAVIDGAAAR